MGVFRYLSILSPVLPIFFFILFRPVKSVKELWVIFFYVIFSFSWDSVISILSAKEQIQQGSILHQDFILLFTLIDYTFVFFILRLLLASRIVKIVLTGISTLFVTY